MLSERGYVVTGGPGSGKTSLIEALATSGYTVFEEVSRRIIREQSQRPDGVLPWHNLEGFAALALEAMKQQYSAAAGQPHAAFFDRALPDIVGYLTCAGIIPGTHLTQALRTHTYATPVFICPPWAAIYRNDPERPQTYADSVALHHHINHAYRQAGYTLIEVPQVSVPERTAFIINTLARAASPATYIPSDIVTPI